MDRRAPLSSAPCESGLVLICSHHGEEIVSLKVFLFVWSLEQNSVHWVSCELNYWNIIWYKKKIHKGQNSAINLLHLQGDGRVRWNRVALLINYSRNCYNINYTYEISRIYKMSQKVSAALTFLRSCPQKRLFLSKDTDLPVIHKKSRYKLNYN